MTRLYFDRFLDPWREFERMGRQFNRASGCECDFPAVNVWVNGESAEISSELLHEHDVHENQLDNSYFRSQNSFFFSLISPW